MHPRYAVISVGRHNLFGHPASSTLQALERLGATVYRTDMQGAITVTSDGHSTLLEPMIGTTELAR